VRGVRIEVMNQLIADHDVHAPAWADDADDWQELASRSAGGTLVRLYWHSKTNDVRVHVTDEQTGEDFVLEPPGESALEAFYHPYALKRKPQT
jgi:YD repeat-containing protein